jgi:hypothetical protein
MKTTVMIIGPGDLGGTVLELLARTRVAERIVVAGRDAERGTRRCNLARIGAMAQGYEPEIAFVRLDLNDQDTVAEAVRREAPALILSTASLLTWWLPDLLPRQPAARLKAAPFGVWLPVHLTLVLKLMEALRQAGYAGHTLTAPFPDVVNPILGTLGLAPTCGVGNLDEVVPKIRLLAARRLGVSATDVRVTLVAHHALERAALGGRTAEVPPHFLRIEHGDDDVTSAVDAEGLLLAPYSLPTGPVTHYLTAGSTVRLIGALLREEETFLHAPGPCGLPGGYPVLAGHHGVRPAPVEGLSLEEAVDINELSHRFDGIDRIEEDGTAVFRPEAAEVMRDVLGYDCERLAPAEAEARARELIARFCEYARKHGVDFERTVHA